MLYNNINGNINQPNFSFNCAFTALLYFVGILSLGHVLSFHFNVYRQPLEIRKSKEIKKQIKSKLNTIDLKDLFEWTKNAEKIEHTSQKTCLNTLSIV